MNENTDQKDIIVAWYQQKLADANQELAVISTERFLLQQEVEQLKAQTASAE